MWFVFVVAVECKDRDGAQSPPGYKTVASGRQAALDADASATPGGTLRRRLSGRSGAPGVSVGRPPRSRHSSAVYGGQPQVQLLSIPQLDAIQRTLRILDVRLQHIQNNVKEDVRARQDIDHIRHLMSENQNALLTVVTVLSSIQEEVRRLSITVHKQTKIQINPPLIPLSNRHHTNSKQDLYRSKELSMPKELKATTAVFAGTVESSQV